MRAQATAAGKHLRAPPAAGRGIKALTGAPEAACLANQNSAFAQEAMERLGGNGPVEAAGEGVMARIDREVPLNSICEGAGNIMALDHRRLSGSCGVAVHARFPRRGLCHTAAPPSASPDAQFA